MKNSEQPAFPVSREICEISKIETYPYGLTKREYFAAMAIQGLASNSSLRQDPQFSFNELVEGSVILADELLKQLES